MSDETTQPQDDGDAQDTEGHKFNIGLGPNSPEEKDEDTEGQMIKIGLGPNSPDEDTEDTEGHKFNIGLGPNTPDEQPDGVANTPDDEGRGGVAV